MRATPIAEAVVSASGNHIFGTRNLAASWPALVLVGAALLTAPGPRLRLVTSALAVTAFAIATIEVMFVGSYQRPDVRSERLASNFGDRYTLCGSCNSLTSPSAARA